MTEWLAVWQNSGLLVQGFVNTLILTVAAIVGSTLLGFIYALVRYYKVPIAEQIVTVLLEVFRGSPLLIQLLFIYFGLAFMGIRGVPVLVVCIITITFYQGAYISEVFRAGLESVGAGQKEAARTLGLKEFQTMMFVILPQSLPVIYPPLFGQFVALVKHTALASVIGYMDILRYGKAIIDREHNPFEVYFTVAVLYFVISYPLSLIAQRLEKKALKV